MNTIRLDVYYKRVSASVRFHLRKTTSFTFISTPSLLDRYVHILNRHYQELG